MPQYSSPMSPVLTCPVCSSLYTSHVHTVQSYSYYRCPLCRTLFVCPQPTRRQLDAYYRETFRYAESREQQDASRERARRVMSTLRRLHPSGTTLLDVGSGRGSMLSAAEEWGIQSCGIEPSRELSRSTSAGGSRVLNISFLQYNGSDRYDYVTLFHVIEHVPDPAGFIRKAYRLLKPGGILYIETPNSDSHLYYTESSNYTFLTPPDHIWIFSQYSFGYLLAGCVPRLVETYTPVEHIVGMVRKRVRPIMPHPSVSPLPPSSSAGLKSWKHTLMHAIVGPALKPLINIAHKGSILALYYSKTP